MCVVCKSADLELEGESWIRLMTFRTGELLFISLHSDSVGSNVSE